MKKASLNQPLSMRKDYGDTEACMLKEIQPLQEDDQMIEVIDDYDKPPVFIPNPVGVSEEKAKMPCPHCGQVMIFRVAALNRNPQLYCPYCTEPISTDMIHKEGSSYRAVQAKCLDPNFKKIRSILKPGKELTDKDVRTLNKQLDTIYKKYRELEDK